MEVEDWVEECRPGPTCLFVREMLYASDIQDPSLGLRGTLGRERKPSSIWFH